MEIRLRDVGTVVTDSEFRALHPTTSFPPQLTEALLDDFAADVVFEGPQPTVTRYQFVARQGVIQIGDKWHTNYVAIDMPPEAQAALDAQQAASVRTERNRLLAESDWTQLPDSPPDALAWGVYRKALRDLPSQPGFPWDIIWPEAPQ
jgi:Phage tail assembly chaperone protein